MIAGLLLLALATLLGFSVWIDGKINDSPLELRSIVEVYALDHPEMANQEADIAADPDKYAYVEYFTLDCSHLK